jgi:Fe-S-cluster-containing hydrogenase component 2
MNVCVAAYYKAKPINSPLACLNVHGDKEGKVCIDVCPQDGKCAEACPEKAITQNDKGIFRVDKKKCTACGECVKACPYGIMRLAEGAETSSKCIACGICVKACPMNVLEVQDAA